MSNANTILLLDNNESTYSLLQKVLTDFNLLWAHNIDEAALLCQQQQFDLFLVSSVISADINADLEGLYQHQSQHPPIIYLTEHEDNEDNLNGLDYCNLSSVTEPYGFQVLVSHITHKIEQNSIQTSQQSELAEVTNALLALQHDNAKLSDINRFLQHSFFCPDINSLCEQFFSVTHDFNTSCVLYIHSEKNNFFITDGPEKQMNNDILKLLKDEARIFQFGSDRAVFNWTCASLLVNKLGANVDNLALLMDGFEIGFNAIESVDDFHQVLKKYRIENQKLNVQVASIVEDLASKINEQLSSFGAETSLTLEQEEALMGLAEQSRQQVDNLFSDKLQVEEELTEVITNMRTQKDSSSESTVEEDTIDFF